MYSVFGIIHNHAKSIQKLYSELSVIKCFCSFVFFVKDLPNDVISTSEFEHCLHQFQQLGKTEVRASELPFKNGFSTETICIINFPLQNCVSMEPNVLTNKPKLIKARIETLINLTSRQWYLLRIVKKKHSSTDWLMHVWKNVKFWDNKMQIFAKFELPRSEIATTPLTFL